MSADPRNSYDEVPYDSYPYPQTHPDRLATVALLLGLKAPRVDRCRVLELGCASGGNIVPLAFALPGCSFVGVDLSSRQIAEARRVAETLGLANLDLRPTNLLDIGPDLGRFDYILCHGVYSWVPPEVQDKILDICAHNLAPAGVAYISYNTYPGWHMRGMIRDIMCYHAKEFARPLLRVKHARNLLDFLARSVADKQTPFSMMLKSEVELIRHKADSYLFHDHMEEVNDPVYFHQFAERAMAKGLHFLGEVDLRTMVPGVHPPEVENVLEALSPDVVHMEQYKDFLHSRMFRQTLLCLKEVTPRLVLRPDQLPLFHVASPARPVSANPDLRTNLVEKFEGPDEVTLNAHEPLVKAAMVHLSHLWPRSIPFPALLARAREMLDRPPPVDTRAAAAETEELGKFLVTAYASTNAALVELHVRPPQFMADVSERPTGSPLARLQAERGGLVTNLRHECVRLEDFDRQLLRLLDGRRDRGELSATLTEYVTASDIVIEVDGQPVRDSDQLLWAVGKTIETRLPHLARWALLVG